jgi:hypothetical protein
MEQKIYEIGERKFRFAISLEQDEILAPIIEEMLKDKPDVLASAAGAVIDLQKEPTSTMMQQNIVSIALDMVKLNAWVYAKRYARKIMAILLIEEGMEFDEKEITNKMLFFGKHASREQASELVNLFFQRSGAFGISTPQSLIPGASPK